MKDEFDEFLPGVPILGNIDELAEALYQQDNQGFHPDRPFDGQPHTCHGERGRTLVRGLRMRDISDCIGLAFLYSCKGFVGIAESGQATWNDVYDAVESDPDFDPVAVMQNALCEIEKRMGIYPNVPALPSDSETEPSEPEP